jgi:hypothetical protein
MGRWISRDPLGEGVDYNLYRYCGNNPISCIDPDGLYVRIVADIQSGTMTVADVNPGRETTVSTFKFFSGDKKALNDSSQEGLPNIGPVPRGKYSLGNGTVNVQDTHPQLIGGSLEWIPILNEETDRNVHYVFNPETGRTEKRTEFYIHPGLVSQGCVTMKSDIRKGEEGYPGSKDFNTLLDIYNKTSTLTINGREVRGELIVK